MKANYMENWLVKLYLLNDYILSKNATVLSLAIDGIEHQWKLASFQY